MASDPSTPDSHYIAKSMLRTKLLNLWNGTQAMRDARELHLPKEKAEDDDAYNARIGRSVLFNGFRKTIIDMADKIFAQPVTLKEDDTDPKVIEWSENIDLCGTALNNFAYALTKEAMRDGIAYVFVDMPPAKEGATLADEAANNHRPYFVIVREEDVLSIRSATVGNRQVLSSIRLKEVVEEQDASDEFKTNVIEQIRVVDMNEGVVSWRTFRKKIDKAKIIWIEYDKGLIKNQTEIPFVPFYVNQTGFYRGEPQFKDLAELNITHWQSSSDQRTILHVARVPILFASGFLDTEKLVVSAGTFTKASDKDAKLSWVEHSGAAIKAGAEDLKDLEQLMQAYGLEMVVPKGSNNSATGEFLDAARKATPLTIAADNLADCLEQCFVIAARFTKGDEEKAGTVIVKNDFAFNLADINLDVLLKAVTLGIISRQTWRNEAKRRGSLSADVNDDDEKEKIDLEGDDTGLFNDPNGGKNIDKNKKPIDDVDPEDEDKA